MNFDTFPFLPFGNALLLVQTFSLISPSISLAVCAQLLCLPLLHSTYGHVIPCKSIHLLLPYWLPPLCLASTVIDRMAFTIYNFTIPHQPLQYLC